MKKDEDNDVLRYSAGEFNDDMHLYEKHERNQTMAGFTGERDYDIAPSGKHVLHWHHFCTDFYSTERQFSEVSDIANNYGEKFIDLRPYMVEYPYVVLTTDKLPKCLELFRHMHLRALPVNDPNTGRPVAVLTRQDIFAYMSL